MEFHLVGLSYLEGARKIAVVFGALDANGERQTIGADFDVDTLPEVDSLLKHAVDEVGAELALRIEETELARPTPVASISVDTDVSSGVEALKKAREEAAQQAAEASNVAAQ